MLDKKSDIDLSEWLGTNLKNWAQSIRNGYTRAFIIFALHEAGVFNLLRKGTPKTAQEIASKCNLEPYLLESVLNFLYHSDKILIKRENKFSLSKYGDWLFTDMVLTMAYGAIGAASCLLYELVPCLRKEKKYGVDFVRSGDLVAKGSYYTGKQNYPWIVDELKELKTNVVADLGCGSAEILINVCKANRKLKGIGIDISAKALEEARGRIINSGLSRKIRLVPGDIAKPETYYAKIKDVEAFNAMMVMHEFLQNGEQNVVEILRGMKECFPGRYLFIGELDPPSDEEYQSMPYPERIHPLFAHYIIHPLTWGGYCMKKDRWVKLFKKAKLEIVKIKDDFYPTRLVEYVLRF